MLRQIVNLLNLFDKACIYSLIQTKVYILELIDKTVDTTVDLSSLVVQVLDWFSIVSLNSCVAHGP